MPVVMGKKLSQPAISAFGNTPVRPILPSTTTTIGAMASTGNRLARHQPRHQRAIQRADMNNADGKCDAGG